MDKEIPYRLQNKAATRTGPLSGLRSPSRRGRPQAAAASKQASTLTSESSKRPIKLRKRMQTEFRHSLACIYRLKHASRIEY